MKVSVNIKMEENIRNQAKDLFNQLGLDMTTAVNMFLIQAIKEQALPFKITIKDQTINEEQIEQLIDNKIEEALKQVENGKFRRLEDFIKEVDSKYGNKI